MNSGSQFTGWQLHWLEASGDLGPWQAEIETEIDATHAAVSRRLTPPRLDILLQRQQGRVIPEIGMVGNAYRPNLFALTLDPDNANFAPSLVNGALRRQVAHEVHHCLRMAGPGYGRTLGEALVSEGLAGQFVRLLFNCPPEPWECAVDQDAMRAHLPDRSALAATDYDHASWFYGTGGARPRWIGYTLGYTIAGAWLATDPDLDAEATISVPADAVLSAWSEVV
ncbi:MAG: DUF2268 domain-containing putative Zn-dependent protease [Alphaproteobacteria bacterium]|nr:DUF2268 domain-containing putative Zn-dependent protease [Alphaproteobacteria bacterium]